MKKNINKYLSDIGLNLLDYKIIPNKKFIEQLDFKATDMENETIFGSIFISLNKINIYYITKNGIKHLFSCLIKSSSINDCVIQNIHFIIKNGKQEIINKIIRENVPKEEYFNFYNLDKLKDKTKVLAMY